MADAVEHIELLRDLSLDLKRSKLTPEQCATGLIVLSQISECGLDPKDINRWPFILKSAETEDEAQELVRLVYSIDEIRKRTSLGLGALEDKALKLERKAADLEPVSKQYDERRKQLAELNKERDTIAGDIADLNEKYKLLNPRVKDLEKREQYLTRRIENMETKIEKAEAILAAVSKERQRLLEIGLTAEALAEFAERVQSIARHHNIIPSKLRDRLLAELAKLEKEVGLEALINTRKLELERQKRAVDSAKREGESLKAVIASLKQKRADLEAIIEEITEKVGIEIAEIAPAATDEINRLIEELKRGHEDTLAEVRRLMDETLEVGKEVGQYEQMLRSNQWLSELLALAQGDESIEGNRVRVIVLTALRGASAWLKCHSSESSTLSSLSYSTDSLVKELERWQT